ncbi:MULTISPECIES: type II toxin-antitoxin system VapC family toxin [unclassified Aliiroseovarius]|uniref:type II toxin-antitoxin system VapC family toxin n=1 Tax=unclassified Aliiroseovarius TaxID=2623558 RepID=UPI0015699912|nr:Toxin FitB [Aliiroseovarius sp. xm-m-314]NRP80462.1 Toxin FitB [Aliiroseovarius sp. xm-v-209]
MSYLIDTNVISELRKGDRCDPAVVSWWAKVDEDELWTSALVLGEIRRGIELARRRDPQKAKALEAWLDEVVSGFGDRVLHVDAQVADEWGRMNAIRPLPVIDALIAATARANGLIFVTRNGADVQGVGVDILNPFED